MTGLNETGGVVLAVLLVAIAVVVVVVIVLKWVVRSGAAKGLILEEAPEPGKVAGSGAPSLTDLVGQRGEALTTLRPAGAAMFGDRRTDVVTEATFIPRGATVEVTAVEGKRVIVRQVLGDPAD